MAVTYNTNKIVMDGLVLYLDAPNPRSANGTAWRDISGNDIPVTIVNPGSNTAANKTFYFSFSPATYNSTATYYEITDPRVADLTANVTLETYVYIPGITSGDVYTFMRPVNPRTGETVQPYGFALTPARTASTGGIIHEIATTPLGFPGQDGNGYYVAENASVSRNLIDYNRWIHVTQVQDDTAKTLKTYVNGQLLLTTAYQGTPIGNTGISIGRSYYAGPRNFTGRIAFVRLYNRPFSQAEITQNYNAVRGRFLTPYQPLVVDSSLKLWLDASNPNSYPGTGTTWTDLSGVNRGTLVGPPTYSSLGQFSFNGVNQYVDITAAGGGAMTGVTEGSDTFTICGWIRSDSAATYTAWFTKQGGGTRLDLGILQNNSIYFTTYNATSGLTDEGQFSFVISLGVWYHFALVCTTSYKRVYINAVRQTFNQGSETFTSSWPGDASPAIVGGDRRYNGGISEIQVYNRALLHEEISQNFNSSRGKYNL